MSQMKLFSVQIPNSEYSTEWYVAAEDMDEAAETYAEAVMEQVISVDLHDIEQTRDLYVEHVGSVESDTARILDWESEERITRRLKPFASARVEFDETILYADGDLEAPTV